MSDADQPGDAPAPEPPPPADVGAAGEKAKDAEPEKGDKNNDEESVAEDPRWAAGRRGAASSGRRHRQAAEQVVNGDRVAGDLYIHIAGDRRVPLHRMPRDVLALAGGPGHLFPDDWDDTRGRFGLRRAAILAGGKGQGRTAAAVRLMLGAGVDAENIFLLPGDADLTKLAELIDDGQDRAGFLLCEPDGLGGLRGYVLQQLESSLDKANARLVLITGADTALADEDLVRWRIPLPPAPDRQLIMRSHLTVLLDDEDAAEQLLRQAGVAQLAAKLLAQASCEAAYLLAFLLSREPADAVDVARVRAEMARREQGTFGIWFDRLPDLDVRCHAIALAVLDGNSYEEVSWAARRLAETLEPEQELVASAGGDGIQLRTRRADPFRRTKRQRLELLEAVDDGDGVRFRDNQRAARVLERVWGEYPVHDELLEWLGTLVDRGSDQIAAFAGSALGKLTTLAYDRTTPTLRRWANAPSYYRRVAVATALQVAAREEGLRERIEGLVGDWYADREQPLAQATAARVYGINRYLCDTRTALDVFGRFLRIRMRDLPRQHALPLQVAVAEGLADLAADAGPAGLEEIYGRLRHWFNDPERTENAQLAFLVMASGLQAGSDPRAPAELERWPLLLYLAGVEAHLRDPLVTLWRGAIHLRAHEESMAAVLTDWAAIAERDPALRDLLVRVVRMFATADEPCRRFVTWLADTWTDDERLLPLTETAGAVNAVLGR